MRSHPPGPEAVLRRRVWAALWQAVWADRRRTAAALALLLLAKAAAVLVPLLLKAVIDRFSRPETMAADVTPAAAPPGVDTALVLPVFLLLGYALLRFAGTLFTELRDLVFARVTQRTVADFAERAFAHLLSLSHRFHARRSTGVLIRSVERGTAGIGFLLGAGLFTVLPTLVEFGAVVAVMAIGYSGWFTLVIMLTFFAYAALTMAMTQTRALRQRRVNELDSRANGRLVDSLLNVEAVKAHAREAHERQRYAADLSQWMDLSLANQRSLSMLHIAQAAIIAAGVSGVMLLAGEQTVRGAMSVGDLVLVNAYVIQICLPLNALGYVFRETRDALVDTEQLFTLLDERAELEAGAGTATPAPPLRVLRGELRFEAVDFSYEPGRQILDQVSFTIPPGHTVAVVGGSGSGKSTLARLLMRLYEVDAGRITIDGQDLRAVDLASLRRAVGLVPQDTTLFNDTIGHNIGYGRPGAGLGEVVEAAQAAQLHDFIAALPAQYDTPVGERGVVLSGGEKQRVAIARAFLKNPPIMVLDEATSALDTRAERAIQQELDRIAMGRSTLIIAHRLSTIVDADEILVMDKGRIVERGRHDALLGAGGLYAQLWALQRQQQQVEQLERRLARRPVNLAALVRSVLDGLQAGYGIGAGAGARGLGWHADPALADARVLADPGALAAAVWTIGAHAVEATPPGGEVEIRLERVGDDARLSITEGRPLARATGDGQPAAGPLPAPSASSPAPAAQPPLDPPALAGAIEQLGGRFGMAPATASRGTRWTIVLPLQAPAARAVGGAERPSPT